MRKITLWLDEQKIPYTVKTHIGGRTGISIPLEQDLIWINGFGDEMKWDRSIWITQDTRKKYHAWVTIGYNRSMPIIEHEGKQSNVIEAIKRYFSEMEKDKDKV